MSSILGRLVLWMGLFFTYISSILILYEIGEKGFAILLLITGTSVCILYFRRQYGKLTKTLILERDEKEGGKS